MELCIGCLSTLHDDLVRFGIEWCEVCAGWEDAMASEDEKHDYIPGTERHPMHTDPLCKECGQPKKAPVHR